MDTVIEKLSEREMGRVTLCTDCIGSGQPEVVYRLTGESVVDTGEPMYGIELELLPKGERLQLGALSGDGREVEALLLRLMRGAVTPATAADVVYDWLVEREGAV